MIPTVEPVTLEDAAIARAGRSLERRGAEGCDDATLLALAIGGDGASLRRARGLLDTMDGLPGVVGATVEELAASGVDAVDARRLVAGVAVGRRAGDAWPDPEWRIGSPADAAARLVESMAHLEREELWVLLLDTRNVVRARRTVYVGNLAGTSVRVGEVFRDAVRVCAAAIVVVHNHPSGDPSPSGDDLRITAELAEAGRLLDIELLDHLVIGRGRWISLRALGALGQDARTMR